ncbi:MAG: ArsR family transcriptional regulator [Chloroflexi bacterium]|nr:ArsR family transcriptional regulator [Chloroflexota bacterium]
MSATREVILKTLKSRGTMTIADLAASLGVSPVSIRHHLSSLQAEGLIAAEEARHGVGRPHLVYSLTEAGLERFPAKYVRLSGRLLDELKATLPTTAIEAIFERMAESMVADYAHRLAGKSLDQKMSLLVEMLGEEGFMAGWNMVGETYQLTEYNCPYFRIGQKHPEVCRIDQTLISHVLELPVEKNSCVLDGDERCIFTIVPTRSL